MIGSFLRTSRSGCERPFTAFTTAFTGQAIDMNSEISFCERVNARSGSARVMCAHARACIYNNYAHASRETHRSHRSQRSQRELSKEKTRVISVNTYVNAQTAACTAIKNRDETHG